MLCHEHEVIVLSTISQIVKWDENVRKAVRYNLKPIQLTLKEHV